MKKTNASIFRSYKQHEVQVLLFEAEGKYISVAQLMKSDSSWSAPANIIALHKWIHCSAESIQIQFSSPFQEAKGAENGLSLLIHQLGF